MLMLTIEEHGSRLYDVNGARLPSVTTILGKTKNQQFLKDWKAKVGEKKQSESKMYLVIGGQLCTNSWSNYIIRRLGYDDLTALGQEAKAMAEKIIDVGLTPVEEYYGSEITLYYPGLYAGSTDLVCLHNNRETVVDFKQANRPKRKNGSKIIICKSQHTPWHMTTYTNQTLNKELSWYARLTYIIKNLS